MLEGKENFCQVCTSVLTCLVIKLALGVCANLNQDLFYTNRGVSKRKYFSRVIKIKIS